MSAVNKCPVCSKNLEFKQINMETAVEICADLNCIYPVEGKCRIISRKLEEIVKIPEGMKPISQIGPQKTQLDCLQNPDIPQEMSTVQKDQFTEELDSFLSNVFENTVAPIPMQTEIKCTNDPLNFSNVSNPDLDELFDDLDFSFN